MLPVSAAHGLGVGDLLDRVVKAKQEVAFRQTKLSHSIPEESTPEKAAPEEATPLAYVAEPETREEAGKGEEGLQDEAVTEPIRVAIAASPMWQIVTTNRLSGPAEDDRVQCPAPQWMVDITFTYDDTQFVLVDTAGMGGLQESVQKLESWR